MKISIVIPTRNRHEFLANLLFSILKQTIVPNEVLIVDDSDTMNTAKLVDDLSDVFSKKGITLKYLRGDKENMSISNARNIGIFASSGDVIFFIDDDVILDKRYIEEIMKVYKTNPMAKGVQGFIVNIPFNPTDIRHLIHNSMRKIFLLDHFEKNKCIRRGGLCYPYSPEKVIECEWLHGSNMSFRREVLVNFRFDDIIVVEGRSIGEDVRLSSKIYIYYPHSLFMNPQAKVCHMQFARKTNKNLIYLSIPYFIYRSIDVYGITLKNVTRTFWKLFGQLIVEGFFFLAQKNIHAFLYFMKSYLFAINNFRKIIRGGFRFVSS